MNGIRYQLTISGNKVSEIDVGLRTICVRACVSLFILTVTAFTVLFTAWYRPNCIFTYLCYHYL